MLVSISEGFCLEGELRAILFNACDMVAVIDDEQCLRVFEMKIRV